MRRRWLASMLGAMAVVAVTGCLPLPPAGPTPPDVTTQAPSESPVSTLPAPEPVTSEPAVPNIDMIEVTGQIATVQTQGNVWTLELLELGPVDLDQVMTDPGGEPAEHPDGELLAWACFAVTLEPESIDDWAWMGADIDFAIGEVDYFSATGFETVSNDISFWLSDVQRGTTLPRTCQLFVVPEDEPFDDVTVFVRSTDPLVSGDVLAP